MPKLTTDQIVAIDKALWDIEIRFLDIRIEMIDHAATSLEGMEGDFDANLERYIAINKGGLKKSYRRFSRNASLNGVKLLLRNMFTFRFIVILAAVYTILFGDYKYEGYEEVSTRLLIPFVLAMPAFWVYIGYKNFTQQKKLFSTAERLFYSLSGVGYLLCVPVYLQVEKLELSSELKLLYSAFVISFVLLLAYTYRSLTKMYNSRYQVA